MREPGISISVGDAISSHEFCRHDVEKGYRYNFDDVTD